MDFSIAKVQGGFFLVFGLGLMAMAVQSLKTGVLPFGSKGLQGKSEVTRDGQQVLYWIMFTVYGGGGLCLAIYSLRLLSGAVPPLSSR